METYQKAYALLFGKIDDVLTIMDTDNLMEFNRIRQILTEALEEAEEMFVMDEEDY